jgi:hypothetical protein
MKLTVVFVAFVALLAVSAAALEVEREVREYTNDMEYVDHVDLDQSAQDLPVADHSMIEHTSEEHSEQHHDTEDDGPHFSMETEAEESLDDELGLNQSFLEADSNDDIDTSAMRAMALEINDAAQAQLSDDAEVLMEMDAEAETESEVDADAEMELDMEADPSGLSSTEVAQEKKDQQAERNAAAAEAADKAEEAADKKEASADAAAEAAAKAAEAQAAAAKAAAPAPAPVVVATAAPAAPAADKTIVQLPPDLSAEHAETIRVNEAATKTIQGAMAEMNGILASKDNTIRSLIYNISYLTVSMGKLANKVDLQRAYIGMLRNKLHIANLKNKQLHDHVEHSADTVVSIRGQLKAVEDRLNKQDKTTQLLSDFLTKNQDKIELPPLKDDLEIRGTPVVQPRSNARLARRVRAKVVASNSRLRPVPGTQVFADAHVPAFIPATNGPVFYPSSAYFTGVTPFTHPTYEPYGGHIPTIVVEREDSGN